MKNLNLSPENPLHSLMNMDAVIFTGHAKASDLAMTESQKEIAMSFVNKQVFLDYVSAT